MVIHTLPFLYTPTAQDTQLTGPKSIILEYKNNLQGRKIRKSLQCLKFEKFNTTHFNMIIIYFIIKMILLVCHYKLFCVMSQKCFYIFLTHKFSYITILVWFSLSSFVPLFYCWSNIKLSYTWHVVMNN